MSERDDLLKLAEIADQRGDTETAKQALQKLEALNGQVNTSANSFRPLELTARHGVEGLAEVADIFTNPIRAGLNLIPGAEFNRSTSELTSGLLDRAGLAKPETPAEEIVGTATRSVAGLSPFIKAGSLLSGFGGVSKGVGGLLKNQAGLQSATAATAGAGGESAKQSGANPLVQFGATLLAGMLPSGVNFSLNTAKKFTKIPTSDIDKVIIKSGVDVTGLNKNAVNRLKTKISEALKLGDVDEAALKRMADFERTGTTATKASVTLDPIDVTQQKNIAKVGANSSNPQLQQLSRVENENNAQLIQGLNDLGGDSGLNLIQGGRAAIAPIEAKRQGLIGIQKGLYEQAKDSTGRAAPLNRSDFINRVDDLLIAENLTAFLPKEVKKSLNLISRGQVTLNNQTHEVPFNVNTIDQLKTTLATEQRSAKGGAKQALSIVRQALDETQLQGGAGDDAIKAFDAARKHTRSLKQFEESIPAIKAIVDGTDPDRFMEKFIIGKTASVDDVAKLAKEIKADPQAFGTVKGQIAAWLKDKALSGKADEVGLLSSTGLNRALKSIGDGKLSLFFSADELEQFKSIKRVASYEQFQPAGAAVNNSNTATTIGGGLLSMLDSITNKFPTIAVAKTALGVPFQARNNIVGAQEALMPGLLRPRVNNSDGSLAVPLSLGLISP